MTRYLVGWASTSVQMGAFEATLKYTQERLPVASFQMVQDLLARMLANVTACQCLMVRQAQTDDDGGLADHHASLAKGVLQGKITRDGRVGPLVAGRQWYRRRPQRRALLRISIQHQRRRLRGARADERSRLPVRDVVKAHPNYGDAQEISLQLCASNLCWAHILYVSLDLPSLGVA
jgi:hypothetical protein